MPTYNLGKLSGSTDGKAIKVAATATPGTLIHTAVSGVGDDNFDKIYLWAMNTDTTERKLTLEWGGVASPDDLIEVLIPPEFGLVPVVLGLPLQNGKVVGAFCSSANIVTLLGWVNKVRP